jgi:putative transposase
MKIHCEGIYHFYNRGNNKQKIFFSEKNYLYFLKKCHQYLPPVSDVLAWCLMPNHFHFLLNVTSKGLTAVKSGNLLMPAISNGFRLLQSSYAKGINKEFNRSGNLFQQKTKARLTNDAKDHSLAAFHYIHQNPKEAGLVKNPEEWAYSSFRDYAGLRKGSLCNREKAYEIFRLAEADVFKTTSREITAEELAGIL